MIKAYRIALAKISLYIYSPLNCKEEKKLLHLLLRERWQMYNSKVCISMQRMLPMQQKIPLFSTFNDTVEPVYSCHSQDKNIQLISKVDGINLRI